MLINSCIVVMDGHGSAGQEKVNSTFGVKDIVDGAVFDQLFAANYNKHNEYGYSRNTLYQCIRNHILSRMKGLMDKEVESLYVLSDKLTPTTVTESSRKLISSQEMVLVLCDVKRDIDDALSSIPLSASTNVVDGKCVIPKRRIGNDSSQGTDIEGDNSVISSYFASDNYLFCDCRGRDEVTEQQFLLSKLRKASLAEVFETSCWFTVRVLLKQCLSSKNETVFYNALRLHARYLLSSSNAAMYESFMNLKSSVKDNFLGRKLENQVGRIFEGISLNDFVTVTWLKILNLISEFFRDGSKKYVRLPLKLIEEIIENVVDLISCSLDGDCRNIDEINTLHLYAIIDPKAVWAKRCFHHTIVRVIAFKKLSESPILIRHTMNVISDWFKDQNCKEDGNLDTRLENSISSSQIRFATFSHCLHLFCYCFRYKEGRNIYMQSTSEVTLHDILKSFIRYLNNSPMCKISSVLHELFNKHIALHINSSISSSLYKILFLEPLFEIYQFPHHLEARSFPIIKPHVVKQMKVMLQTKMGLENLLACQRFNLEMETSEISPIRILLFYCCKCLMNYSNVPIDTLKHLLDCCVLVSRSPKGLAEMEESNIISVFAILFCQLKGKTDHGILQVSLGSDSLLKESLVLDIITLTITSLAAISGRVWLMDRERVLLPVLLEFYKQPTLPWSSGWFQKLVLSSTLLNGGCEALVTEKVQRMPLLILWKPLSVDSMEHFSEKNMESPVNIFFSLCSSLRGVKSLLIEQEGSEGTLVEGKRPPETLQELFEFTLGIIEEPNKPNGGKQDALPPSTNANNFQEVYFGLRILRFMLSSLDTTLLLQHRFLIQEHLMKISIESLQEENVELIFNENTISCEQILRNCFFIECCHERNACRTRTPRSSAISRPECLSEQGTISWSSHYRSHSRRAPCRLKNGLVKFLGNTRHGLRDINWLCQLRKAFYLAFNGNISPEIKCNVLLEILEEVQKVFGNTPNSAHFKLNRAGDITSPALFPEDFIGIKLAIRYGVKLTLLLSTPVVHSNFAHLLRSTYGVVKIGRNEFLGFDWFLATVFLLCCGNIDRCQLFINNILRLQVVPFLWVTYGDCLCSEHSEINYRNDFLFLMIEQVELVLSIEVPKVFAAFQLSSGSLAILVHQWMSQCFWNVLEWTEIKNFLCITIMHEPDYMVYFCVAVLLHLEPLILHIMSTTAESFWEQIKTNPVTHFHLGKYILFIERLYKTHHNSVIKSLMKCFGNISKSPL